VIKKSVAEWKQEQQAAIVKKLQKNANYRVRTGTNKNLR
jgi:hypothetical protein